MTESLEKKLVKSMIMTGLFGAAMDIYGFIERAPEVINYGNGILIGTLFTGSLYALLSSNKESTRGPQ